MASSIDFGKFVKGEEVKCIVRIKPPSNFQKEDVRINNQNIILTDPSNRILEEFEVSDAYGPEFQIQQIYEQSFAQYIGPFIQGFHVNIFAFGSSGAGKSQTLEGGKKERGLIQFYASSIFSMLENKKFHTNNAQTSQISSYSYGIRVRFVEIIDEELTDLLAPPNKRLSDQLVVQESSWEGPMIANATWVSVTNETQLSEVLASGIKNRNNTSNEFGKVANKATGFFTIELIQTSTLKESNEPLILLSRLTFFDLPGSEVLIEDPETIRIKQGSTLNKVAIAFTQLLKELGQKQSEFILYDTSSVTTLNKEILGSNSLTLALFCIQNADQKGTSLTLNMYKYCKKIQNFPIVNDAKSLGVLHKFRAEAHQVKSSSGKNNFGVDGPGANHKMIELERKLIEDNLDKMRQADDRQKMAQKLSAMREKYNELIRHKAELQQDLIKSEEDKLEVSKALVELQIENTRLMEIIQNEKYEMNNKLLNAESDLLTINVREEKALRVVQELQDRMRDLVDEKRDLEIEFVALKKNYINISQYLEAERAKAENVGLELINIVNENKALHQELNDIYKKSGSTNDENSRFSKKVEKMEQENRDQREALIFGKAEIERLKTEMLKYEILEQQHRIDIDNKKLEMEKGFLEANREKFREVHLMNKDQEDTFKKVREDRLMWESQKIELTHKIKSLSRRVNDEDDRIKDLEKQLEELLSENQKMQLQMDEMRSIFRNKLIQFTTDTARQPANNGNEQQRPLRMGYDLNAREELIRTYTEKEIDLNEKLDREKKQVRQIRLEIRAIRSYARNLRYLAEDWAPIGVPLPDVLSKEPAYMIGDEENYGSLQSDHKAEIERLRVRNRKLENEVRILQENVMNGAGNRSNGLDMNRRLVDELQMLQGSGVKRPLSGDYQIEQLRKERNELQEENRRLVQMLKDNRKWDIHTMQRENERLMNQVKDYERGSGISMGTAMGPQSGEVRHQQKLAIYERSIKQLERERSELMVRATMAEEQLKSIQEHMTRQTQDYQRKIVDLKRQQGGGGRAEPF